MSNTNDISIINECNKPLHTNPVSDFLLRYLINNPKTKQDCPDLASAVLAQFSEKYQNIEDTYDALLTEFGKLYLQGIASRYAIEWLYIREQTISLIASCIRTGRMPQWEGNY